MPTTSKHPVGALRPSQTLDLSVGSVSVQIYADCVVVDDNQHGIDKSQHRQICIYQAGVHDSIMKICLYTLWKCSVPSSLILAFVQVANRRAAVLVPLFEVRTYFINLYVTIKQLIFPHAAYGLKYVSHPGVLLKLQNRQDRSRVWTSIFKSIFWVKMMTSKSSPVVHIHTLYVLKYVFEPPFFGSAQ